MAVFSVQAAPQIDFNIEATVPDSEFYVNSNNGWDANTPENDLEFCHQHAEYSHAAAGDEEQRWRY